MTRSPDPAAVALARLYDVDLQEDPGDLDLYLALARRTEGPILELAVGSGRLAVPLAAAGWSVTGVDIDAAMLARARTRALAAGTGVADRIELVEADLVGLGLPGRYRLAILAFNSLLLLTEPAAQAAALRSLADHLAPGGLAVVDVWLPDADDLARYDGRVILEYVRTDPETSRSIVKTGSALHDAATQVVDLTTIFDEAEPGGSPSRWVRRDRLRLVGVAELRAYAESAGLTVESIGGSYDLEPIGHGATRAVLIATRS